MRPAIWTYIINSEGWVNEGWVLQICAPKQLLQQLLPKAGLLICTNTVSSEGVARLQETVQEGNFPYRIVPSGLPVVALYFCTSDLALTLSRVNSVTHAL